MRKTDFENGDIKRCILSIAIPMMGAQFLSLVYNIVDRIYIGNLAQSGGFALGGIGICFPVITIINGFANLFGLGGAPLFSIERGKRNDSEAKKIMSTSFWMLAITGIILTVIVLIFHKPILQLFGASENTYKFAADYLVIYALGTVFQMISLGMNPFINCQGFAKTGMMTIVVGAVVNLILDPIFIFTFDLGVKGAAIATVLSQFLSALWVVFFITGKKPDIRLNIREIVINIECVANIIKLGTASFIMHCTDSIVQIVCNNVLLKTGGDFYISIMTVINSVRQIIQIPVTALTDGASTIISFNYGAKRNKKVKNSIIFMTITTFSYTIIVLIFIMLFPKMFLRIFGIENNLLNIGARAMRIYFSGFFMMALQYSGQCVYKSLNMPKHAIFFSLFRKVIIVVPLTLLLPYAFGTDGIFLAEMISNFVGGGVCYITMYFTVKRILNKNKTLCEVVYE